VEAARTLFLRDGYAGTTVEEIAALAGLAKRTVYNVYADKDARFREIVDDIIDRAEAFARELPGELAADVTAEELPAALHRLGERLARAILHADVIALRRLLIGEARAFPELAREYFARAPGRVLDALTDRFEALTRAGVLCAPEPRQAAEQLAYLLIGAPLDRALLAGDLPEEAEIDAHARAGVETFLMRFGRGRRDD